MATRQELENALRKADAAGNVDDARAIAQAIRAMGQEKPTAAPQPQAVSGRVPTLEETNASNRAYMASPQAQTDRQAFEESQAAAQREDFQSLPAPMRAMIGGGSAVNNMALGVGQLAGLADGNDVAETRQNDQFMSGDIAATGGRIGADIAMTALPLSKLSKLGGATKLGRYATSALGGGVIGGLQPVAEGESRSANAGVGLGLGVLGQGLTNGLTALGNRAGQAIDPLVRELSQVAKQYNIPLHASQISSSMGAKLAASAGKYLPFSGSGKAAANQQQAFNRALGETMGLRGATKLSDDAIRQGKASIGKTYDDVFARNDVALDKAAMDRLAEIKARAARSLDKDNAEVINKNLEYLVENTTAGKMPGKVYQSLRGELTGSNDKVGAFLKDIRKALDEAAERSVGPDDAAALKKANAQWANARTIQDALKQAGGAAENVNPANLWNLVRKGSTKEMRDLARLGQVVLKDPIPDSGTAQRSQLYTLLAGGGLATGTLPILAKLAVGGATLGRAANSPRLADLMLREGRGQSAKALAPYAKPVLVGATPVVTQKKPDDSRKRP